VTLPAPIAAVWPESTTVVTIDPPLLIVMLPLPLSPSSRLPVVHFDPAPSTVTEAVEVRPPDEAIETMLLELTTPPPVMFTVPAPLFPTVTLVVVRIDPAPSTSMVPFAVAASPSMMNPPFAVAPASSLNWPVPISPTRISGVVSRVPDPVTVRLPEDRVLTSAMSMKPVTVRLPPLLTMKLAFEWSADR